MTKEQIEHIEKSNVTVEDLLNILTGLGYLNYVNVEKVIDKMKMNAYSRVPDKWTIQDDTTT